YLIPFGGLLLLAGRLGDLLGRKRILISGLVVFTAASLLCGVAGNQQLLLADRLLDSEPGIGFAQGADALGAALITSSLMLGVYTIVGEAADNGWTSSRTLVFGGVALLLFVSFVAREATHPRPLLPLRVFKSRN